jgi:hypothetical protein
MTRSGSRLRKQREVVRKARREQQRATGPRTEDLAEKLFPSFKAVLAEEAASRRTTEPAQVFPFVRPAYPVPVEVSPARSASEAPTMQISVPVKRPIPAPAPRTRPPARAREKTPWDWEPWGYELPEPEVVAWTVNTLLIPRYDKPVKGNEQDG